MPDDITLAKTEIIERCLRRIETIQAERPKPLSEDLLKQDAILLNLERACQAAIDLAMHRVRVHRLGIPKESREPFTLLEQDGRLEPGLAGRLRNMVGFRNIAIHNYQDLNPDVVQDILQNRIPDLQLFASQSLQE